MAGRFYQKTPSENVLRVFVWLKIKVIGGLSITASLMYNKSRIARALKMI